MNETPNSEESESANDETANSDEMSQGNTGTTDQNAQNPQANPLAQMHFAAPFIETPSLKGLDPEDVISFLHSFDCAKEMVSANGNQRMLLKAYIDGRIMRELSEVYKATTDEQIREVLQKIVDDYDANKFEDGLIILREQLKWPAEEATLDRAVTKFIQDIKRVMSKEDLKKDKMILKQVVKEAIRKLPKYFNLEVSDHANLAKYIEVGQKKLLPKSQFDLIKQERDAQRSQGIRENLLDQFEQYLRMKAWANRDNHTTKQKLSEIRQIQTTPIKPSKPALPPNQPIEDNAPPPNYQPFARTEPAQNVAHVQDLTDAMDNLTRVVLANQLQAQQPQNYAPRRNQFQQGGQQQFRRQQERKCFCCGQFGHVVQQCPTLLDYFHNTGQVPPFIVRRNRVPRQPMRPANPQARSFQPIQPINANFQSPRRDPNRASDIIIRKMEGINGKLNVEQATIQVYGTDQNWHTVKGCLDSGATVSVGSVHLHEKFCGEVEHMRKMRDVVLPNKVRIRVVKQGKIYVRARHADGRLNNFPLIKIALVDSPEWDWLLIGWNELYQNNATPEQALYANSTAPALSANLAPMFNAPFPATVEEQLPPPLPEQNSAPQIDSNAQNQQ